MTSSVGSRDSAPSDVGRAVVEAVAKADGLDPIEIERPLGEVVDVDALNMLFAGRNGVAGRVSFRYSGYDVTISSDDRVTVERPDASF